MNNQIRSATGIKTRKIKSISATVNDFFEFNKSIVPHGGTLSKLNLKQHRNGSYVLKLFQDTNNDGRIYKKEMIFRGQTRVEMEVDHLTNFRGKIHLAKNMHRCEWIAAKFPGGMIACTMEYIPTTYSCLLIDSEGAKFEVDGIDIYASDPI